MPLSDQRYALILLSLFLLIWTALAIDPLFRDDWMLENVLTAITLPILIATHKRMLFSKTSYLLIFLFLSFHTLGSHYTYAEVPYEKWVHAITGGSLNALMGWERNQFDRIAHFIYGLLLVYPIKELFSKITNIQNGLACFVVVLIVASTSMMYEVIEWGAAELFGGDLGVAYLGTQGDVWDAQKDMLLATIGSVIAAVYLTVRARITVKDKGVTVK